MLSSEDPFGVIFGPAVVVVAVGGIEEGQPARGAYMGVALRFETGEQRAL